MDQLRTFVETVFFHSAESLPGRNPADCFDRFAAFSEREFVDTARRHEFVLSDDALRLIYHSWEDIWSRDPDDRDAAGPGRSALNAIFHSARYFLRMEGDTPCVDFNHLFRWRQFTRLLGEDIFVCAYLAWLDRDSYGEVDVLSPLGNVRSLGYPPSLHNDNTTIRSMTSRREMQELHCHLGASSKVLDINWVSLMNNPARREKAFYEMIRIHDSEDADIAARRLHEVTAMAAAMRFHIYRMLCGEISMEEVRRNIAEFGDGLFHDRYAALADMIDSYRSLSDGFGSGFHPDYIRELNPRIGDTGNFSIYTGERHFLYMALRHALRSADVEFHHWMRYYILAKSLLRMRMVQLNANHGFSNFQRYQDTKGLLLDRHYRLIPPSLAIADAVRDSNVARQEVRIAPKDDFRNMTDELSRIRLAIDGELDMLFADKERRPSFGFIYHFIKKPDNARAGSGDGVSAIDARNSNVRRSLRRQSDNIRRLAADRENLIVGIDAASSEFNCRPEVFGQAFRYLRNFGLKATFHAGEDFYDVADGIRAIDEAVTFLRLGTGDRLGHALAMGIDTRDYYARRHNRIAIPAQWMLDNIVWLYCRARDWNIRMQPAIERFLLKEFRSLYNEIYVNGLAGDELADTDIETYHLSMKLRGDNPDVYNPGNADGEKLPLGRNEWDYYAEMDTESTRIAAADRRAVALYVNYHYNGEVRRLGNRVKEFHVCPGYAELMTQMQEKMMDRVERHGLIVECCPSSNVQIGSLMKFEKHPIFRFHDIDPNSGRHLAVTVNTDDLGVFQTSLANEFSYLALSQLKRTTADGTPLYTPHQISNWLRRIAATPASFERTPLPRKAEQQGGISRRAAESRRGEEPPSIRQ